MVVLFWQYCLWVGHCSQWEERTGRWPTKGCRGTNIKWESMGWKVCSTVIHWTSQWWTNQQRGKASLSSSFYRGITWNIPIYVVFGTQLEWGYYWLFDYLCLLSASKHQVWVFILLLEMTVGVLATPTFRSWWSQWGVMTAHNCYEWWRWWSGTLWVTLIRTWCAHCHVVIGMSLQSIDMYWRQLSPLRAWSIIGLDFQWTLWAQVNMASFGSRFWGGWSSGTSVCLEQSSHLHQGRYRHLCATMCHKHREEHQGEDHSHTAGHQIGASLLGLMEPTGRVISLLQMPFSRVNLPRELHSVSNLWKTNLKKG
jgi:hypothetical protein